MDIARLETKRYKKIVYRKEFRENIPTNSSKALRLIPEIATPPSTFSFIFPHVDRRLIVSSLVIDSPSPDSRKEFSEHGRQLDRFLSITKITARHEIFHFRHFRSFDPPRNTQFQIHFSGGKINPDTHTEKQSGEREREVGLSGYARCRISGTPVYGCQGNTGVHRGPDRQGDPLSRVHP